MTSATMGLVMASAQPSGGNAAIRPFRVDMPEARLAELRRRIAATRCPSAELVNDSSQGVQCKMLQKLARYWEKEHDWRRVERRLKLGAEGISEPSLLELALIRR